MYRTVAKKRYIYCFITRKDVFAIVAKFWTQSISKIVFVLICQNLPAQQLIMTKTRPAKRRENSKWRKIPSKKVDFFRIFSGVFLKFSFFWFCRCHYHGFAAVLEHSFPQGRGGPWASKHHPRQFILKDSACYHANAEAGRAERSWLHIPLQRRIHCSGKNGRAIRIRRIWR